MTTHSTANAAAQSPVAGIDVGKASLHLGFSDCKEVTRHGNDAQGHREIAAKIKSRGVARAGLEATGSTSRGIELALRAAGLDVDVLQPRQVKAFARFKLSRAKSDEIDTPLIAQATAASDCKPAPDPRLAGLCEHLTLIDQIGEDIAREKVRREHVRDPGLLAQHAAEIKRQTLRRAGMVKALGLMVRAHEDLAKKMKLLLTIPGVGEITALAMVLRMPELGALTREEAAALPGVAPFVCESGRCAGQRHVARGRDRARRSLFAAAQAACRRWNKELVTFYDRLKATGKHHRVCVVACTRKLVIFANTVLQRQKPWTEKLGANPAT